MEGVTIHTQRCGDSDRALICVFHTVQMLKCQKTKMVQDPGSQTAHSIPRGRLTEWGPGVGTMAEQLLGSSSQGVHSLDHADCFTLAMPQPAWGLSGRVCTNLREGDCSLVPCWLLCFAVLGCWPNYTVLASRRRRGAATPMSTGVVQCVQHLNALAEC